METKVAMAKTSMNTTLKVLKGLDYLLSSEELHDIKQGIPQEDITFLQRYCEEMSKATDTALKLIGAYEELEVAKEAEAKKQENAKKAKKKPVKEDVDIDLDGLLD